MFWCTSKLSSTKYQKRRKQIRLWLAGF